MTSLRLFFPVLLGGAFLLATAQSHAHEVTVYDDSGPNRSFALVHGSSVMINGRRQPGDDLDVYAHAHAGNYIAFLDAGSVYRLDDPKQIDEAERAYAPMLPLTARQNELSAQQRPLAEQQRVLAKQQQAATGHPSEQARIGQEQGRVGEQQGALGEKQGEIGRQQGVIGLAFYAKVQAMLTTCLADHSCRRVSDAEARR